MIVNATFILDASPDEINHITSSYPVSIAMGATLHLGTFWTIEGEWFAVQGALVELHDWDRDAAQAIFEDNNLPSTEWDICHATGGHKLFRGECVKCGTSC